MNPFHICSYIVKYFLNVLNVVFNKNKKSNSLQWKFILDKTFCKYHFFPYVKEQSEERTEGEVAQVRWKCSKEFRARFKDPEAIKDLSP